MAAKRQDVATRDRLIAAAVELIGEVGWHRVSTRLIAERAGVNQALVHYHFGSVPGLLTAATTAAAETLIARTAEQLSRRPSIESGVDLILSEVAGYTADDPEALLLLEAFLASTRLPELREGLAATMVAFRESVSAWLQRLGAASGRDADLAAAGFTAAIDGIVLHSMLDPAFDVRAQAEPLRRLLTAADHPARTSSSHEEES